MKEKTMLVTAALLISLLVAACGGKSGSVEGEAVTIDTASVDTTTPQGKIERITELLKFGPKNWELWMKRAKLLYEVGNMGQAISDINRAIEYSLNEPEAYYVRGFIYYGQKNDSAALRDFKRAADLSSTNPDNYHQIGNIYFFQGNFVEAEAAYDHAIRLDSMEPTHYLAKGLLYEKQHKIDAAIKWYNTALQRDPTFTKALLALHDVYLNVKKSPDEAYAFNERVMLIDSTQPLAHFNQGNFFTARANRLTDPSKVMDYQALLNVAISEYSLCLKYDPQFVQAIYNRGYSYYLMEKYGLALADFTKVTELAPFHRDGFYMKANIQEFQGDLTSALANYKRALEIDPKFSDAATAVKELTMKLEK